MLPETVQGYADNKCAFGDPNGPGDIAKAKELVKKSGTEGQKVTVWTNNKDPRPDIAQYYQGVLNKIGYKAKITTLDQTVYFDKVGTKSTKAQTGFTDWFQDFPHPADFFGQLLTTKSTKTVPTSNQGFVTDPYIDKQVAKLQQAPVLTDDVKAQWGKLDDYVVNKKAYIVPYGSEKSTSFFSERMGFSNCAGVHPVWKNDWTQFCLK
jgi:peptide/nickel transport system substrate-binding protein